MKKLAITLAIITSVSLVGVAAPKQVVKLTVTEEGFEPKELKVKKDTLTVLEITRKTDSTCSREIQIPAKNIKKSLPLNEAVAIEIGKLEKGEVKFGCGMDMMDAGVIVVN